MRRSSASALCSRRAALATLAVFAIGAGAAQAERVKEPPPPPLLPQFNLAVAEIQIVPAYASAPGASADAAVPFAPKTALETWAKTHVQAVGRQWQAWIVIKDASISARKVAPKTSSWRDWFRRQPVERYEAVLELELQIRDDAGRIRAQTVARATHARFLMDDYRDYREERTTQLQALTDEVIAAALRRLEAEVRGNLARWVR